MKSIQRGFAPLLILIFIALTASLAGSVILWKNNQSLFPTGKTGTSTNTNFAPTQNPSTINGFPTQTQTSPTKNTPIPTPASHPGPTASNNPALPTAPPAPPPPRTPQPPIISISYPAENQAITLNSSQQLCLVDSPTGGNTEGVQRKHSINDSSWSSYVSIFTLCFDPKEGTNRVSLQYRNKYGDESTVYTRQFTFHRLQDITVSITGTIYRDVNCNAKRDSGESAVTTSTTINIFKMPEFYIYATVNSDSSGNYSFSKTITEDQSLSLQPSAVSPSGYKSVNKYSPPTLSLNSSNKNATADIPQVPNENFSSCQ